MFIPPIPEYKDKAPSPTPILTVPESHTIPISPSKLFNSIPPIPPKIPNNPISQNNDKFPTPTQVTL